VDTESRCLLQTTQPRSRRRRKKREAREAKTKMGPPPGTNLNSNGVPDFDDLPLRKGDPRRAAWGLYGEEDQLGTLNRLTDERVASAAKEEIRTGRRYVLVTCCFLYSSLFLLSL